MVLALGLLSLIASIAVLVRRVGAPAPASSAAPFLADGPFRFDRKAVRRGPQPALVRIGHRWTPAGRRAELTALLGRAGSPLSLDHVLARQVMAAAAGLAVGAYVAIANARLGVLFAAAGAVGGWLMPGLALRRGGDHRADAIRRALPDALDLLAISVEAGVGLEGALASAADDLPRHPLGDEIRRLLQELQLGLSRREALLALKERVAVAELSSFILALLQADALGISLGRILRTQATEMRSLRRRMAREQAARTPVRILFPLVFGIFPALLIVVLAPAMIRILSALG